MDEQWDHDGPEEEDAFAADQRGQSPALGSPERATTGSPAPEKAEVGKQLPAQGDDRIQHPDIEMLIAMPPLVLLRRVKAREREAFNVGVVLRHVRVGVMGEVLG